MEYIKSEFINIDGGQIQFINEEFDYDDQKNFWELLSGNYNGVKVNYADNRIHHIAIDSNTFSRLLKLKKRMGFIEILFEAKDRHGVLDFDAEMHGYFKEYQQYFSCSEPKLSSDNKYTTVVNYVGDELYEMYESNNFLVLKENRPVCNYATDKAVINISNSDNVIIGDQNNISNYSYNDLSDDKFLKILEVLENSLISVGMDVVQTEIETLIKTKDKSLLEKVVASIKNAAVVSTSMSQLFNVIESILNS